MQQHYQTLNLREGATLSEIKKASRQLLLKYHPDLHPHNQTWAQEKTRIILNAYTTLSENVVVTLPTTINKAPSPSRPAPRTESMPLMVFSLGMINFAVKIEQVKQVTLMQSVKVIKITNRKGLYPFISGIIHYQGSIAPLLNLGEKLQLEPITDRQQVLICEVEGQPLALSIDEGKNVITIENNDYYNHRYFQESNIPSEYIHNVIYHHDEKIHIINLGKLLTH